MAATVQRSEIDVLIGQRVHHVLWRRKIHQRELATELGITQSTLSRRLRGESAWFAGDLVALAQALEVSVGWLFGEDDAARPKGLEPLTFWSGVWRAQSYTCARCGWPSWEWLCPRCMKLVEGVRTADLALAA